MRSLLTTLFILFFTVSNAQTHTVEQVDKQTYEAFMKQDYNKTIELANEALTEGIDFYFLRTRLGISYFVKKNYEAAITHFEKAQSIFSSDPIILDYLYYSYLYTKQNEKADELIPFFPPELREKYKLKTPFFKTISAEGGILKSNAFDTYKNADLRGSNASAHGTFYSDVTFGAVLIENQISPNFKLKNQLTLVSNTSNDLFQLASATETKIFTDKDNYLQWNAIGTLYANGWVFEGGFGVYNSNYMSYTAPDPSITNATYSSYKISNINFSTSFSISKKLKYIQPTLAFTFANLYNLNLMTTEGSLSYFPLGNLNFYGNTKLAFVSGNANTNTVLSQLIGLKLSPKIWIEGYGAIGNHLNYISENGLIAFNTPNKINWYTGTNLNFYFKNIDCSLGYGVQQRESTYEIKDNASNTNYISYKYNYSLIKTKIVWKF